MDHYLDTDALADGLPLYVSLYPTEGGMQDIIDCIRAELGVGTTKNAVFQHIQSLPRGQQKEALLASAALEHIRKPLAARQALTRSEAVLQKSLDITEEADLALRNAMARIK
ncbi:hypothetical protein J4G40_21560 [Escherichia coli]